MALSKTVQDSLTEAESSLRNALAYAARQERPIVCTEIAKLIKQIEHIQSVDDIIDMLEDRKSGSRGSFGPTFDDEDS